MVKFRPMKAMRSMKVMKSMKKKKDDSDKADDKGSKAEVIMRASSWTSTDDNKKEAIEIISGFWTSPGSFPYSEAMGDGKMECTNGASHLTSNTSAWPGMVHGGAAAVCHAVGGAVAGARRLLLGLLGAGHRTPAGGTHLSVGAGAPVGGPRERAALERRRAGR